MARRALPPLNGLRAFEVAARHMSFTRAAAELHVTQSAVSHQIRGLEARLGVALFRRAGPSGLVLTDTGQRLLPVLRDAFDRLSTGIERVLQQESAGGPLTLSVSPYFASKWLIPRLGRLRDRHPEIDLRLSASQHPADFAREDVDAAVRHGTGGWEGLRADRLFDEEMFPICSPALLETGPPLKVPADLAHHTLLNDVRYGYWDKWLAAAGVSELAAGRRRGRVMAFDDVGLVVQAALAGLGVGIGRWALCAEDLATGRLVRPFDLRIPADYGYYLVCPEGTADRPKIARLRAWLVEEGRRPDAARFWPPEIG
ncbi:transcriptional regulator GcvA [Inquilinus limosus]|uniref:transcriptional regulator GcvA n=1 Tax=Inquilinus limosus TaxID=171674 RepID=UPI003F18F5C6